MLGFRRLEIMSRDRENIDACRSSRLNLFGVSSAGNDSCDISVLWSMDARRVISKESLTINELQIAIRASVSAGMLDLNILS